jgi:aminoglycoside phosphotransferase (APT) family kinase protein
MPQWDAEVTVDESLARSLIAEQFPQLDVSELRLLGEGWDNIVWATRDGVAFRFPRRSIAVALIEREIAVLPMLAPLLPVPIPDAAFVGERTTRFRWPWFGSSLISGQEVANTVLDETARTALAASLGRFLRVLHDLEPDLPIALPVDPIGRADMAVRVPMTRSALQEIEPLWTPPAALAQLLTRAEALPQPRRTTLVHGDLHVRHVLVSETGRLAGVIDWGDLCRADPAVDLPLVWSLLSAPARGAFFAAYGPVDEASLLRARVLAVFLCAVLASYAATEKLPALLRETLDGLDRAAAD